MVSCDSGTFRRLTSLATIMGRVPGASTTGADPHHSKAMSHVVSREAERTRQVCVDT